MKIHFIPTFIFLLLAVKINAQIGLLETNSFQKNRDTIVNVPFDTTRSFFESMLRKFSLDIDKRLSSIEFQGDNNSTRKYFIESIGYRWNGYIDSIGLLKKIILLFRNETTSTDFKMWNYFTRFEDSNQVVVDYVKLVDSLSDIYKYFDTLTKRVKVYEENFDKIEADFIAMRDSVEKWRNLSLSIEEIAKKDTFFNSSLNAIKGKTKLNNSLLKNDFEALKLHQQSYNRVIEFFFKKRSGSKQEEKKFGALPQVTSIIGERETVPGIQFLGRKLFGDTDKDFLTGEMGLLLGMQSNPDRPNLKTLFVEQASSFHLYTYFNYGFGAVHTKNNNQKRLAINLHLSYSIKKILTDTLKQTKIINPSLFHTQTGIELAIFVNALSVYGNVNTLSILDKVNEFRSALNVERKFYGFIDCGAKIFLDPEPTLGIKNAKFFINANFIVNGGDVKYITRSEDVVIPNIQIGIKTSF